MSSHYRLKGREVPEAHLPLHLDVLVFYTLVKCSASLDCTVVILIYDVVVALA